MFRNTNTIVNVNVDKWKQSKAPIFQLSFLYVFFRLLLSFYMFFFRNNHSNHNNDNGNGNP